MFESRKRRAEDVNEETSKRRLLDCLKALKLDDFSNNHHVLSSGDNEHQNQQVSTIEVQPGYLNIPASIIQDRNDLKNYKKIRFKSIIEYQDFHTIVWIHFINWYNLCHASTPDTVGSPGIINTDVSMQRPDINMYKGDINMRRFEGNMQRPGVSVQRPDISVYRPDINVHEPGCSTMIYTPDINTVMMDDTNTMMMDDTMDDTNAYDTNIYDPNVTDNTNIINDSNTMEIDNDNLLDMDLDNM